MPTIDELQRWLDAERLPDVTDPTGRTLPQPTSSTRR